MKISLLMREIINFIQKACLQNNNDPKYRVIEIFKDEDDNYKTKLQIVNKSATFYAKPEEILADDNFVDCLSPRDVRALTYLGYLSINQPQYKILAQKLSEKSDIFIIKKRGAKKPIIKTAAEIAKETEIITQLDSKDAKVIGYAIANNEFKQEKLDKDEIKNCLGTNVHNALHTLQE